LLQGLLDAYPDENVTILNTDDQKNAIAFVYSDRDPGRFLLVNADARGRRNRRRAALDQAGRDGRDEGLPHPRRRRDVDSRLRHAAKGGAPIEHAERLRDALTAAGAPPQWLVEPHEGHGFYDEGARERMYTLLLQFLRENTAAKN